MKDLPFKFSLIFYDYTGLFFLKQLCLKIIGIIMS
jgi:hypothetical protein